MADLESKIRRLKDVFPAGERPVLIEAANCPTYELAVSYLTNIYGQPTTKPSPWAKPLLISSISSAPHQSREQARIQAIGDPPAPSVFMVENYKIKPCKNQAGCTCDNYHHEFERRRDPNRYNYSEIPCLHVFVNGVWKAPGFCKVGDGCSYAHSVNEASYHPRIYKTKVCVHYENASCHYGSRCAYIHDRNDSVAADWKKRVERRNAASQVQRPTESRGVQLANFLPPAYRSEPAAPKSTLRASAWEFTPPGSSPLELMNMKLQSRVEELYLKTLCSICYQNEKNCALVPCGHLFCAVCMEQTLTAACPICRKTVTSKLEVFL